MGSQTVFGDVFLLAARPDKKTLRTTLATHQRVRIGQRIAPHLTLVGEANEPLDLPFPNYAFHL
jgi:hypothetical protein